MDFSSRWSMTYMELRTLPGFPPLWLLPQRVSAYIVLIACCSVSVFRAVICICNTEAILEAGGHLKTRADTEFFGVLVVFVAGITVVEHEWIFSNYWSFSFSVFFILNKDSQTCYKKIILTAFVLNLHLHLEWIMSVSWCMAWKFKLSLFLWHSDDEVATRGRSYVRENFTCYIRICNDFGENYK